MLSREAKEIQEKVILILGHINKRLRILPQVKLPVQELIELYGREDSRGGSQLSYFLLLYIRQGLDKAESKLCGELVPPLLAGISRKHSAQQDTILHIFKNSLEHIVLTGISTSKLLGAATASVSAKGEGR